VTENSDAADTRWLSDTELAAWIPLSGMLIGLLSALDTQLRDVKLSLFGYLVLAGLSEAPERTLAMSDLAVRAGGSLSRLSHAVSALERQGWVTRHPAPANGRITLATLTEAGHAKLVASAPAHVETVRRLVIDPLTKQQLNQLARVSEAILTELNAASERPSRQDRTRMKTRGRCDSEGVEAQGVDEPAETAREVTFFGEELS
jgi:DNA-binding MarR family transcriptional regulator